MVSTPEEVIAVKSCQRSGQPHSVRVDVTFVKVTALDMCLKRTTICRDIRQRVAELYH
jgi:hypothetical protein